MSKELVAISVNSNVKHKIRVLKKRKTHIHPQIYNSTTENSNYLSNDPNLERKNERKAELKGRNVYSVMKESEQLSLINKSNGGEKELNANGADKCLNNSINSKNSTILSGKSGFKI